MLTDAVCVSRHLFIDADGSGKLERDEVETLIAFFTGTEPHQTTAWEQTHSRECVPVRHAMRVRYRSACILRGGCGLWLTRLAPHFAPHFAGPKPKAPTALTVRPAPESLPFL